MRDRILHISKLVFVLGLALPGIAWGQASPQAEALFRDGKRLMKGGKLAEACAAFEGSERAEHNLATLLSLADCREKNHQYASAWALFLQAESQTRSVPSKATFRATAKARALALESKLSYLTINVPDESRIPELVVTRDGAPVDPAEWNRSIPADGGNHVIAGKAPGHESWSTTVTLMPSDDKQAVEVPKFKALPEIVNKPVHKAAEPPPHIVKALPETIEPSPFTQKRQSPLTQKRQIGIGVAAGGVVVAGVAIYLGLDAQKLRNEAVATCPPSACSSRQAAEAQDKNDRARGHGLYANVGFGVAGAAVAAGVVLWFIGKPAAAESPAAAPARNNNAKQARSRTSGRSISISPQVGVANGLVMRGSF